MRQREKYILGIEHQTGGFLTESRVQNDLTKAVTELSSSDM